MNSLGNEDELATGRHRLPHPGFSSPRQGYSFSFDRASASSGVHENFCERLCLLLVRQRIIRITKDGVQPAADGG